MARPKVAFVTGAGSGFGKALSTRLVEKGWKVALLDINEEHGLQIETTLGPSTKFFHTDVSSYASQSTAFASAFSHFGRLDALCANAGIVDRSSLYLLNHHPSNGIKVTDLPPAPDTTATDTDYKGVVYGFYLATHFMRFNPPVPEGEKEYTKKLIATASCSGVIQHPALPEYSGAKSAVVGFVRAVAPVMKAKEGISVSAVCPGLAPTAVLPPWVIDAVGEKLLTPIDEVVKLYEMYLGTEGDEYSGHVGLVMERDRVDEVPATKLSTDVERQIYASAMEPIFLALHGVKSGLDTTGWF